MNFGAGFTGFHTKYSNTQFASCVFQSLRSRFRQDHELCFNTASENSFQPSRVSASLGLFHIY